MFAAASGSHCVIDILNKIGEIAQAIGRHATAGRAG